MFCPKCSTYLTEKELIKTEVKYAPGNVPIEYVAICPNCNVEMGKVSWGQLTVAPGLEAKPKDSNHENHENRENTRASEKSIGKICPHCGKSLPENF